MRVKLSKKRAISTVLTTVIILVSSVVLGTGVVLYGTSLFQSSTLNEAISVTGVKLWVHTTNPDGLAWGAAGIRNIGDKVLSADLIVIRGTAIPFGQWYQDSDVSPGLFSQALNHTGWDGGGLVKTSGACGSARIAINNGAGDICAPQYTGPFAMLPGGTAIVYFQMPNGTLTPLDSGLNTSVNIYASKAGAPQSVAVQSVG
jgi:hypothetical protein